MSPKLLDARTRSFALLLFVAASFGAAACGQEGKVNTTSTSTSSGPGGGGSGGSGGTGGATTGGGGTGVGGFAETAEPLKVLNWNLHNFFDTQDDPQLDSDFALTTAQYNTKLAQVGAIIKELDPDVAFLPEVEHQGILDDLNNEHLGGAYTTAITETNDFRGLDIGVLSKLPIVDVVTHKDDSFKRLDLVGGQLYKYSRDAVEVHFNFNSRPIVMLGVHYRSKGDGSAETDDKDRRMAEAQHTRAIADKLVADEPKRAVLILGDFNDLPGSPPVSWTLQGDPANNPKITFCAATDGMPPDQAYSFVYMGVKELIDHQMANPLLCMMVDKASATIRHGADVEDASDHFPMMVTYKIQ